jgi:hypothetical protein
LRLPGIAQAQVAVTIKHADSPLDPAQFNGRIQIPAGLELELADEQISVLGGGFEGLAVEDVELRVIGGPSAGNPFVGGRRHRSEQGLLRGRRGHAALAG